MDEHTSLSTYCLFCVAGKEESLVDRLERFGYAAFIPMIRGWKPSSSGAQKKISKLMPGYVFFDAPHLTDEDWYPVWRLPQVVRALRYGNGEYALRDGDKAFVAWVKSYDDVIEVSEAVQVGTKLHFVHGPLKERSGNIIKVNKKRKSVLVSFGDTESLLGSVWCSYDYAESNMDTTPILNTVSKKYSNSEGHVHNHAG